MIEFIDAPSLELAAVENKIQNGLMVFEERKETLTALRNRAAGLKITDIADKKNIEVVSTIRKQLKNERVQIEKEGKAMRDQLTKTSRYISTKENELIAIIEPTEKELLEQERWVDAEKKRIEDEKAAIEKARIQSRIDKLAAFGFAIELDTITGIDDATFNKVLQDAEAAYKLEQERKAEEERQRLAEIEKLRLERIELENLRKQQAEAQRVIDENNARIAKEQEAAALAIKIEQDKIAAENERIERERLQAEQQKKHDEQVQKARIEAAEQARVQAIEDAKNAELLKAERLAQSSDKVKFESVISALASVAIPEMKSKKAKKLSGEVELLVVKIIDHIKASL